MVDYVRGKVYTEADAHDGCGHRNRIQLDSPEHEEAENSQTDGHNGEGGEHNRE